MKACLYQALDLRDNEKTHTQYSVDPVKLFCISITNENLWLNFLLSLGSITSFYFVCIKNVYSLIMNWKNYKKRSYFYIKLYDHNIGCSTMCFPHIF